MLAVDTVFVKDAVIESGVQVNKTTRHRAGPHAHL